MAKTKGRERPKPKAENDVRFKDELDTKQPLSQKDRFWKAARQYLRSGMQSPWDWMNANDGMEAAQESQEDYIDSMEDFYQQNPMGVPGGGTYVGDETATGQASPYAQQGMQEQLTPEALFPPGTTPTAQTPVASPDPMEMYAPAEQGGMTGENIQGMTTLPTAPPAPQAAPQAASAQPTSYQGAPQDQVALAQKYGQQYGVDPGVLLALAKHETDYGTKGAGQQGYTLGFGIDNSAGYERPEYAGVENQYSNTARRLSEKGVDSIDDITEGRASWYAPGPQSGAWASGVGSAYESLAPQLSPAPQEGGLVDYGQHKVASPVAQTLAQAEQIVGGPIPLTGGWRSREQQEALHRQKPGLAAPPGHSFHETGNAIDVDNNWFSKLPPETRQALVDHMKAAGFSWGGEWQTKKEPWHFGYGENGAAPAPTTTPAPTSSPPPAEPAPPTAPGEEEDDEEDDE